MASVQIQEPKPAPVYMPTSGSEAAVPEALLQLLAAPPPKLCWGLMMLPSISKLYIVLS